MKNTVLIKCKPFLSPILNNNFNIKIKTLILSDFYFKLNEISIQMFEFPKHAKKA